MKEAMPDSERTNAWIGIPDQMRREITNLYNAHWVSYNTRKRLEEIFGRDNLDSEK